MDTHDFTLKKYSALCGSLKQNGYRVMGVGDYLDGDPLGRFAIMRHDVDRNIRNALKMAELESLLGVKSTYYFRYPHTFRPEVIRRIASVGHEIGYHYETLAKADGDHERAIRLFEQELQELRKIADVRTICMHGSPLSRYDNRDLWKHEDFRKFGIIGEAYLSIRKVVYLSDTGRSWNGRNNIRDFLPNNENGSNNINTTDEIIDLTEEGGAEGLYILTHPERWASGLFEWGHSCLRDCVFNVGKRVLRRA